MNAILKTCHKVLACYKPLFLWPAKKYQTLMMFSGTEATDQSMCFTKLLKSLRISEYKTLGTSKYWDTVNFYCWKI